VSKNKDYARRMKKMILLKKCLYLIIVGLLCVSCADKYDQKMDCFNPANKEKYGLVLLRAIKFQEQEELRQFQKADTYTYKLLIVDKKDKAKDFMSKYYPNIDFPFVEDTKN
jgi:hypothetical protein